MIIKQLLRPDIKDEYQTQKLQNVILNIMQYIDNLCDANDIEYYIIGGTALGAVRHGGFIPWDDDLDIAMTRDNYNKFIEICRSEQFDANHYYFQEERKDWTGYFSKVRFLGTYFQEIVSDTSVPIEKQGVFIDIFPLDNVPNNKFKQYWWYFCGKMLVAYEQTTHNGYRPKGLLRKLAMLLANSLNNDRIRLFFEREIEKYNDKETAFLGGHSLVSRFSNTFSRRELWGRPKRIPFETISLLAPHKISDFLTFYFGNYMVLPPEGSRRGHHAFNVDLGNYK